MILSELLARHRALVDKTETREDARETVERLWEPLRMPEDKPALPTSRLEVSEAARPASEAFALKPPENRETTRELLSPPLEISYPESETATARAVPDSTDETRRIVWSARRLPQEMEEE